MKRFLLIGLVALSGCSTPEQRAAQDDDYCKGIGAQPGTPVYVECRLRRDEVREARRRAALQDDGPRSCTRFGSTISCF